MAQYYIVIWGHSSKCSMKSKNDRHCRWGRYGEALSWFCWAHTLLLLPLKVIWKLLKPWKEKGQRYSKGVEGIEKGIDGRLPHCNAQFVDWTTGEIIGHYLELKSQREREIEVTGNASGKIEKIK